MYRYHVLLTSALVGDEWSASRPCLFTPGGKNPRYLLDRMLCGPQRRSGRNEEVKILEPTGLELRPLGRPARRQSLYRLRYRSSSKILVSGPTQRTPPKIKLHGLSPPANYADRATAACRRSDCQLLRVKGDTWSA
jgi:hypothetical protein